MTAEGDKAADTLAASGKATESLSQFVARVLNQLAISAWLPAAALVLLLTIVVQIAAELNRSSSRRSAADVVNTALGNVGRISLGGALLLISAVVVLTIVTQAFSFEAIRVLEGYWGTNRIVERVAQWRCDMHRSRRVKLDERHTVLTRAAWTSAQEEINRKQDALRARGRDVVFTPDMIAVLRARVLGEDSNIKLSPEQRRKVKAVNWLDFAPPDIARRRLNVDKRRRDYPKPHRILPTRLGNVLRRHEDNMGVTNVERFVQEAFDRLPLSMKVEHDEQRTRLDLYCSMVFVVLLVNSVAVILFLAVDGVVYALGAAAIALIGIFMMYRAAIASARAYGGLLLVIANRSRSDAAAGNALVGSSTVTSGQGGQLPATAPPVPPTTV